MNEIGGDFHWQNIPTGAFLTWESPYRLFSTARAIVVSLATLYQQRRLWIPDYFCPRTSLYWQTKGLEILRYLDHPLRSQPDWSTLQPTKGDIVLAVNFFGIRSGEPWQIWHTFHTNIVLIEDHTHDPFSAWARNSKADYGFASIRKIFPVPDGALVWSPVAKVLPPEPKDQNWAGSALKLAAMMWKKEYIEADKHAVELKLLFRQFQTLGEEKLEEQADQRLSPWSHALLQNGFPAVWRDQREHNVREFLDEFPDSEYIHALFERWPQDHCPFNAVLITDTHARRDKLRQYLIDATIFPPIHWSLPSTATKEAQEISRRVLTLPLDHRCTSEHISRIVTILREYLDDQ